jgi:hypothetical protein
MIHMNAPVKRSGRIILVKMDVIVRFEKEGRRGVEGAVEQVEEVVERVEGVVE